MDLQLGLIVLFFVYTDKQTFKLSYDRRDYTLPTPRAEPFADFLAYNHSLDHMAFT